MLLEICVKHIKRLTVANALMALIFLMAFTCSAQQYEVPRLPSGSPDLQGVWTNVSLTTLIRSGQYQSNTISFEEAKRIETMRANISQRGLLPTDPNAPPPSAGANVGGYNSFWGDAGDRLAIVNGEYRTTWLVDPPNGQLPYTIAGKKIFEETQHFTRTNFDDPEARPMAERCIIGFGSTGGPPMINVLYNNNYQIVQTKDEVMILVEMNHDARIIRLNSKHKPDHMKTWMGDSIGHWEENTLVIQTKNFNPGESLRLNFNQSFYISENATVTERLTRISDTEIFYEFAVDDPDIYSKVWKGEMVFNHVDDKIYEYACHEGNYALPGILRGAREEESLKFNATIKSDSGG